MTRFYTGIGSRETPLEYLDLMTKLAQKLASEGWILRSGGADGADTGFENGAPNDRRAIYLPWSGFNGREHGVQPSRFNNHAQAENIASRFHPAWDRLTRGPRALMARNVYQLLGDDLQTPSRMVICWAPNPKFDNDGRVIDVKGGTGLAVRLAVEYNVPVYHLGVQDHMDRLCKYLGVDPLPIDIPALPKEGAKTYQKRGMRP